MNYRLETLDAYRLRQMISCPGPEFCAQTARQRAHDLEREGPQGIFGEMSLIENEPRDATSIAETDVTLAAVSQKAFLFCVSETPNFALKVMRALARQLRAELIRVH